MTSVLSPLPINPDGYTILLGYEPDRNVFAGYDLTRHTTFTSGSPSVQVNIQTLNSAMQNGLAFETKSNEEIVVGIRSDLLMFYSQYAADLSDDGIAMRLNYKAVDELRLLGLAGGIDEFGLTLGSVHLPFNPQQRPDPYFIRLANEYRGLE